MGGDNAIEMDGSLSVKKMILDALGEKGMNSNSIGMPEDPVLPLYGSMNVQVEEDEER